jgi:hypothetical protein
MIRIIVFIKLNTNVFDRSIILHDRNRNIADERHCFITYKSSLYSSCGVPLWGSAVGFRPHATKREGNLRGEPRLGSIMGFRCGVSPPRDEERGEPERGAEIRVHHGVPLWGFAPTRRRDKRGA